METKKIILLGLVFGLSVVFFWLAINQYILPSRAQLGSNLQVTPQSTNIECNPQGECSLNILGTSETQNAVAGVSGVVLYGDGLEPVRLDKVGLCAQNSLGLNENLQFANDPTTKTLRFTVGTLNPDNQLKGGVGCITTVVFAPSKGPQASFTSKIVLAQADQWKAGGLIGGQRDVFQIQLDETAIQVKVDPSVQWPPAGETSPQPSGPAQCRQGSGDCNCDGATDLVDFEQIRSYINNEGKVCDVNNDSKGDSGDVRQWLQNNTLLRRGEL